MDIFDSRASYSEQREKMLVRNLKFLNRLTNLILHARVLVSLYEVRRQVTTSKE